MKYLYLLTDNFIIYTVYRAIFHNDGNYTIEWLFATDIFLVD